VSKHRREKSAREITVDRIAERVAALVEPSTEYVSQRLARPEGLVEERHLVEHPGLLDQLADPGMGGTAGVGSSSGGPSAPIHLGPLSTLQDIDAGASLWWAKVDRLGSIAGRFALAAALADIRADRPEDLTAAVARLNAALNADTRHKLAQIVRAAPTLPDETLWNLDRDVMRWWAAARVATTWDDPPRKLHVPCPECAAVGKILVRFYPTAAICTACSAVFDRLALDQLGEHLQLITDHEAAARAERHIEHRTCPTCGEHHVPGHYLTTTALAAHEAVAPAVTAGRLTSNVVKMM